MMKERVYFTFPGNEKHYFCDVDWAKVPGYSTIDSIWKYIPILYLGAALTVFILSKERIIFIKNRKTAKRDTVNINEKDKFWITLSAASIDEIHDELLKHV